MVTIPSCALCDQNPDEKRRYAGHGLADGIHCPLCQLPACRYHLSTVRWRQRSNNQLHSTQICRDCSRQYRHRSWDVANRDWIT